MVHWWILGAGFPIDTGDHGGCWYGHSKETPARRFGAAGSSPDLGFFATWRSKAFVLNFLSVYSTVVPRQSFLLSSTERLDLSMLCGLHVCLSRTGPASICLWGFCFNAMHDKPATGEKACSWTRKLQISYVALRLVSNFDLLVDLQNTHVCL